MEALSDFTKLIHLSGGGVLAVIECYLHPQGNVTTLASVVIHLQARQAALRLNYRSNTEPHRHDQVRLETLVVLLSGSARQMGKPPLGHPTGKPDEDAGRLTRLWVLAHVGRGGGFRNTELTQSFPVQPDGMSVIGGEKGWAASRQTIEVAALRKCARSENGVIPTTGDDPFQIGPFAGKFPDLFLNLAEGFRVVQAQLIRVGTRGNMIMTVNEPRQ